MAAIANARDKILQAAPSRTTNSPNAALFLTANAAGFHVAAGGAFDPATITFTAAKVSLDGLIVFTAFGATLSSVTDNTAVIAYAAMGGTTATVTATVVENGVTFTQTCTITKIFDGAAGSNGTPGTNGSRGAGHYYIVGNPWTDALGDAATPGANVVDDVVTVYTNGVYVREKRWNGSNWVDQGTVVDGNLLVTGSVKAAALDAYAVTAGKVNITTPGGAFNRDPFFIDLAGSWDIAGTVNAYTGPGGNAPANTYIASPGGAAGYVTGRELIPISAGKTYTLGGHLYTDGGNDRLAAFFIQFYDATGARLSTAWGDATFSGFTRGVFAPTPGDWYEFRDGKFGANAGTSRPIPTTARYCRVGVYLNAGGTSSTLMACTSLKLEEIIPSVLIQDGAITANKISVTTLTAITADLGTATISTGGYLRSGQTAYNTGTGFWLGSVAGVPQFSIGNPSGAHMRWDGSNLYIQGETKATFSVAITGTLLSSVGNGAVTYGTRLSTVTGGVGTLAYQWYISGTQANDLNANYFASSGTTSSSCTIRGSANNMQIIGTHVLVVTEVATGRTCTATVGHNPTHGTYP
ncbi:MAG TPA: hypothetical protein VGC21_13620 [Telluria sp.]|jgi:hypothetical protein